MSSLHPRRGCFRPVTVRLDLDWVELSVATQSQKTLHACALEVLLARGPFRMPLMMDVLSITTVRSPSVDKTATFTASHSERGTVCRQYAKGPLPVPMVLCCASNTTKPHPQRLTRGSAELAPPDPSVPTMAPEGRSIGEEGLPAVKLIAPTMGRMAG